MNNDRFVSFDLLRDISDDTNTLSKISTPKKSAPSVRSGSSILQTLSKLKSLTESYLGEHKDEYRVITDERELKEYIAKVNEVGIWAVDTETTGLDPISDNIVGLCTYIPNTPAVYIPINHIDYITGARIKKQLTAEQVSECLKQLNNPKTIMHNCKFDIRVIRNHLGINIKCYWDTYLAQRLLNENEPTNGLKALWTKYVKQGKEDEVFTFDTLFNGITFDKVPIDVAYLYGANDPKITYELYEYQRQFLDGEKCIQEGLKDVSDVFFNIEMPCVHILADMEDTGISFDTEKQKELSDKYNKILKEKENEVYSTLNKHKSEIDIYKSINPNHKLSDPININSPSQLAIVLYDILRLPSVDDKQPRGTGAGILKELKHPLCTAILEYKECYKLVTAFIEKLPEHINSKTGRIHCNLNAYGADTGRMSCNNPNLQQIPSHNKEIRQMFIASADNVLLSADYS